MAAAINHSDPGAVPGASTIKCSVIRVGEICSVFRALTTAPLWGRIMFYEGVKGVLLPGMVPPLSGRFIVANDNYAPVAQAA